MIRGSGNAWLDYLVQVLQTYSASGKETPCDIIRHMKLIRLPYHVQSEVMNIGLAPSALENPHRS